MKADAGDKACADGKCVRRGLDRVDPPKSPAADRLDGAALRCAGGSENL